MTTTTRIAIAMPTTARRLRIRFFIYPPHRLTAERSPKDDAAGRRFLPSLMSHRAHLRRSVAQGGRSQHRPRRAPEMNEQQKWLRAIATLPHSRNSARGAAGGAQGDAAASGLPRRRAEVEPTDPLRRHGGSARWTDPMSGFVPGRGAVRAEICALATSASGAAAAGRAGGSRGFTTSANPGAVAAAPAHCLGPVRPSAARPARDRSPPLSGQAQA